MENSTGSAKLTAATPYGRAYPPRFALRPVAFGAGLRLRRGTPTGFPRLRRLPLRSNGWPTARTLYQGAAKAARCSSTACAGQGAPRPATNRQRKRKGRNGLSEKGVGRADGPQNGHQSAREGHRDVFQGVGGPTPAKLLKSAYGASWGIYRGRRAEFVLNPEIAQ